MPCGTKRNPGWKNESLRHAEARRGHKTGRKTGSEFPKASTKNRPWSQFRERRVKITYDTVTEESSRRGDYAESGWKNEKGIKVDTLKEAVEAVLSEGFVEDSGDGNRFYTVDPDNDYRTGEQKFYGLHLSGFTNEELEQIYDEVKKKQGGIL